MSRVPSSVYKTLQEPGQPMDDSTRQAAERRLGFDFSSVRVHTDAGAASSAEALRARAYNLGAHVVFAQGEYAPGNQAGRELLLHELSHVMQRSSDMPLPGSGLTIGAPDSPPEQQADGMARTASGGTGLNPTECEGQLPAGQIARQPMDSELPRKPHLRKKSPARRRRFTKEEIQKRLGIKDSAEDLAETHAEKPESYRHAASSDYSQGEVAGSRALAMRTSLADLAAAYTRRHGHPPKNVAPEAMETSLLSRVGHILYLGSRIHLLSVSGIPVGSGAAGINPGHLHFPGPGTYVGGSINGRVETFRLDGGVQSLDVDFFTESLATAEDLQAVVTQDLDHDRALLIVVSPGTYFDSSGQPAKPRPFAVNAGIFSIAVQRHLPHVYNEMKKELLAELTGAGLSLLVQLTFESLVKKYPIIGLLMHGMMLPALVDLGDAAAAIRSAVTDEELSIIAYATSKMLIAAAIQEVLGLTVRGGTFAAKLARRKLRVRAIRARARELGPFDKNEQTEMAARGWKEVVKDIATADPEQAEVWEARRQLELDSLAKEFPGLRRTGSGKPLSDADVNSLGPEAYERILRAKKHLTEKWGSWENAEKALELNFLTDALRAFIYVDPRLPPQARNRLIGQAIEGSHMRYLQALKGRVGETEASRAEFARAARSFGIDPAAVSAPPKPTPEELHQLRLKADALHQAFDKQPSEELARQIIDTQTKINFADKEAYFEPSAVMERVGRELGQTGRPLGLREAFSDLMNQRVNLLGKLAEIEATVEKDLIEFQEKSQNLAPRADLRQHWIDSQTRATASISKYAYRLLELAKRMGVSVEPGILREVLSIYRNKGNSELILSGERYVNFCHNLSAELGPVFAAAEQLSLSPTRTHELVFALRQRITQALSPLREFYHNILTRRVGQFVLDVTLPKAIQMLFQEPNKP